MRRSASLSVLFVFAQQLAQLGCGPGETGSITASNVVAQSEQGIIGGKPAGTDDPEIWGLRIEMPGGEAICTATLIGAKTLLTAAHCVEGVSALYATNQNNMFAVAQSQWVDVVDTRQHPNYNPNNTSSGSDIALVELAHTVTSKQKQWNMAKIDGFEGKPVRLVGYGVREDRQTSGEKYEVEQTFANIDSALIEFNQRNGKGGCFGDSGGPALHTFADGVERVVGVTSFGEDQCQYSSFYTRVDTYASFITQWLSEKETPTCNRDGLCKSSGCATPDIDCLCPSDGTCNATCPDPTADPDCDPKCGDDGVCATGSCATPDPDCKALGEACESKNECPGRECKTDPQSPDYYCSQKCDTTNVCPKSFECKKGFCLKAQLPEADRDEPCTKGKTFCVDGNVCVGSPSKCQPGCESDSDCGLNLVCKGKDGAQKYCIDGTTQQTTNTTNTSQGKTQATNTPTNTTETTNGTGCAQTDASAAWLVLASLLFVARGRRRRA